MDMKDIEFTTYEEYMDALQEAQNHQEGVCIHFASFLEHLNPVEQILVLQMSVSKLHIPCMIDFPYDKSLPITYREYQTYIKELQKIQGPSFRFDLSETD